MSGLHDEGGIRARLDRASNLVEHPAARARIFGAQALLKHAGQRIARIAAFARDAVGDNLEARMRAVGPADEHDVVERVIDEHAHGVAQLNRLGHVDDNALQERDALVAQVTALVDHPQVSAMLRLHAVFQLLGIVGPTLAHGGNSRCHGIAIIGMHHVLELVVEDLLELLAGVSEHLHETIAHVQELETGRVGAAVVAAGHILVQEREFAVLAQKQLVALGQLLLGRHDLGDVRAGAHNGQAAVFRLHHLALVERPEPCPVLLRHAVGGGVLEPRIVLRPDILLHGSQVVGVDGVAHVPVDGLRQFVVGFVPQQLHHCRVGEVKGESVLAVSADHAAGRHLREDGRSRAAVLLGQAHERPVGVRDPHYGRQRALGRFKLPRLAHLLGHVGERTVIEAVTIAFTQVEHS